MIPIKYAFPLFLLVALAQLYVPAKMVWDKETLWAEGKEYKFKVAPVDPNDPFRGKYITLSYEATRYESSNAEEWSRGEPIYVTLLEDSEDFALIKEVFRFPPTGAQNFVEAKVRRWSSSSSIVFIEYPFDRFYMEESKAYDAELAYREMLRDSMQVAYALVNVKQGEAVLKDVLIDGVPIQQVVERKQAEEE